METTMRTSSTDRTWLRRLGAGLVAGLLAIWAPSSELAAKPEAVVKKVVPWYTYVQADCSGVSSNCTTMIYKVRKKQRLVVTNVSCVVSVDPSGVPHFVHIRNLQKAGGLSVDTYVPIFTTSGTIADYSALNTQTRFYANTGDELWLFTSAENDILDLSCNITGNREVLK